MNNDELLAFLRQLRHQIDMQIKYVESLDRVPTSPPLRKESIPSSAIIPYIQEWLDQGFTYSLLAARSGINEKTLMRIKNGHTQSVQRDTAERILVLGLSLHNEFNELDHFEWDSDA